MHNIPTIYNGVQYRSRLEAKWAAFFDLLGWKYQYEPFDLNGWIPDFLIRGKSEILVEVKPISDLEQFEQTEQTKIFKALSQSEKYRTELLILGHTIFQSEEAEGMYGPSIGWLGEFCDNKDADDLKSAYWFANAKLTKNPNWGFFHAQGSYEDRITGIYDGDHHLNIPSDDEVQGLWAEASNIVQWKGHSII